MWSPQCGRSRQSDILEGFDADVDLVCKSHVAPQKTRRVCRVGVWFGFIRSALLLAVGTCIVLSFEAMLGLCCFLRVTPRNTRAITPSKVRRRCYTARQHQHIVASLSRRYGMVVRRMTPGRGGAEQAGGGGGHSRSGKGEGLVAVCDTEKAA